MKFWLSLAVLVGVGLAAVSACPRIVYRAAVVKEVVVKKELVAVPVFIPTYTASYAYPPPPIQQQAVLSPCEQQLQQMRLELDVLRRQMGAARGTGAAGGDYPPMGRVANGETPTGKAAPAGKGEQLLVARCAACHGTAPKGNHFSFVVEGHVRELKNREANAIARMLGQDKMPKEGPKLSQEEKGEVQKYLDE
jgi:mono/diheme cytochrome c family protein